MTQIHEHDIAERREDAAERERNEPDTHKERKEDAQADEEQLPECRLDTSELDGIYTISIFVKDHYNDTQIYAHGASKVAAFNLLIKKLSNVAMHNAAMLSAIKKAL